MSEQQPMPMPVNSLTKSFLRSPWFGVFLVALAATPTACAVRGGGATAAPAQDGMGPPQQCTASEPLLRASLSAPTAPDFPASKVSVLVDVPTRHVIDRIESQVPVVLAREKDRPVGAPGRATYTVRRGPIRLGLDEHHLGIDLGVSADISVCKPFGGLCLRYGECSPAFDVHFGLNLSLDDSYEIPAPRGALAASRKCVIGLDVTQQLEAVATRELRKVQREIAARWPNTRAYVQRAWDELSRPLHVTPMECLHFDAREVSLLSPRFKSDGDRLLVGLTISGALRPNETCASPQHLAPLPAPAVQTKPRKQSVLWVPELLPLETLRTALVQNLSGPLGSLPGDQLSVREVRFFHEGAALLVDVTGKTCLSTWVVARFDVHPDAVLHLEIDRSTWDAPPNVESELLAHLQNTPLWTTKGDSWAAPDRVRSLLDQGRTFVPDDIRLDLAVLDPKPARTQVTRDGLLILHSVRAQIAVTGLL